MDFIRFALIGLGTGALYAIVASGLVLVYRGSGIVNFAQGAFVMSGAYVYLELKRIDGLPLFVVLLATMAISAILGAAIHLIVLRPMRRSSPLARVIATLGVLVVLQSIAVLHYGQNVRSVPSALPTRAVNVLPDIPIGLDRIIIFGIGVAITAVLWFVYRYTEFGRITSAVAENQRAAASLGHSPDRIAALNWAIGSALAGLAGALIAPISFLEPTNLVLLILPALAAALVGGFSSFPIAFVGALVIGMSESLVSHYVSTPGWPTSAAFLAVIVVLILRGRGLPLRSYVLDRLPAVGNGRVRPIPAVVAFLAGSAVLLFALSANWDTAFAVTIIMAMMCLSVLVITGYGGQLSLAQYVLGGVGAFVAARLAHDWSFPFLLAVVGGVLVTAVVGGLVGIPALRARGINLAIATLGLALVVYNVVLSNSDYTGGLAGIHVAAPTIFGWDINASEHPDRYAFVAFALLFLVGLMVANLRRGAAGRRMLAVRSNERAAVALGVSVYTVKIYAFMLAAAIAALAGTLFAFMQSSVIPSQFGVFPSINIVTATVVGGIGTIGGAVTGSTLISGGVFSEIFRNWSDFSKWLPLIGGLSVLFVLRTDQSGIYHLNRTSIAQFAAVVRRRRRREPGPSSRSPAPAQSSTAASRGPRPQVTPARLRVQGLTVRFGGVTALREVDVEVRPGRIHGLIGPNGAGKTTFIDAVTGFVATSAGQVMLEEVDIGRWRPRRRARAGIARSFQSVELFADLTVRENLAVACDDGRARRFLTDLVKPGRIQLSQAAIEAVGEFGLEADLDVLADSLPFGRRRLVAIARAVAAEPSVLLLDEPAAGLDDAETAELAELIRVLAREWGIAVLLIEHNIDMVIAISDEVTVLANGALLFAGPPGEVTAHPAVLEAYVGARTEPSKVSS